jgi:cytochrome c oxidase subunit 3
MAETGGSVAGLAHQFDDIQQQRDADHLGMWTFIVTEVLFFGGMITGYTVYRSMYPQAWAIGSEHLSYWSGTIMTAVLLISSLTMALSVHAAQTGRRKTLMTFLVLTMILGVAFLGLKFNEYHEKFVEHMVPGPHFEYHGPFAHQVEIFLSFYFAMTGMHALHMIIGLGILTVLLVMAARGRFSRDYHSPVVISGLYWHFVDIVWIFLYPLLYLIKVYK